MTAQAPGSPGQQLAPRQLAEHQAWSAPGVRILVLGIRWSPGAGPTTLIVAAVLLLITAGLARYGLTSVVAGEARAVQLFGRYRGTIRAPGLHWVNPFARRRRVSTRIRNHETAVAKVNDADGNPIAVEPCSGGWRTEKSDDCLAPVSERAWSSPLFLDAPR